MKVKIMLESFGNRVRLSLSPGQPGAMVSFSNLLWVLGGTGSEESLVIARETLAKGIQAFRAANPNQARRGKGLWKQSPFEFSLVAQRNDTREIASGNYGIGNTDCQTPTENVWGGFKSRLAMDNAEV